MRRHPFTFRRKVGRIVAVLRGKDAGRGSRLDLLMSSFMALLVPLGGLSVLVSIVLLVAGQSPRKQLEELVYAGALTALGLIAWGESWRKAVDWPMGQAWYDQTSARFMVAGAWFVISGVDFARGRWGWALFELTLAASCFIRPRRGGGGWDDVPAPTPDPSLGGAR